MARLNCPDEDTMRLALAIAASKPSNKNMREYLRIERQKARRRFGLAESTVLRIDPTRRLNHEIRRLKDLLMSEKRNSAKLMAEVETLRARSTRDQGLVTPCASQQFREESGPRAEAEPSIDRPFGDDPGRCDLSMAELSVEDTTQCLRGESHHAGFPYRSTAETLREVYLYFVERGNSCFASQTFSYHRLVRVIEAIPNLLAEAIDLSKPSESTLPSRIRPIRRLIALIIHDTRSATLSSDNADIEANILVKCAGMFSDMIGLLEKTHTFGISPERSRYFRSCRDQRDSIQYQENAVRNKAVSQLMYDIIAGLDAGDRVHQRMFETFAYLTITKVGKQLYSTVFDNDKSGEDTQDRKTEDGRSSGEVADQISQNLVQILQAIMQSAPQYFDTTGPSAEGKKSHRDSKRLLTVSALERLQRTLVNAVFAGDGEGDERGEVQDDPFKDCLKMPSLPMTSLPFPRLRDDTPVDDWFKMRVWELLGWEILQREDG